MWASASGEDGEVGTRIQGASYSSPEASKGTSETSLLEVCWDSGLLRPLGLCVTIPGASQVVLVVKNPPTNAGDLRNMGLIPGSGRSPGGGHGNPLQYSCL